MYKSVYPHFSDKFILSPNVFDEELLNKQKLDFNGKLKITYTGGFGEKRSPLFYLKAIQQFLDENPEARDIIEFIFTGPMTRANKAIFEHFSTVYQITHVGMIPYRNMIDTQYKAHVLVNIDTNIHQPDHAVFFPSKLLEYLAANRRILNIGNHHAMSWQVVNENYGDCVEFEDYEQIKKILLTYWRKFQQQDESFFTLQKPFKEYAAGYNAKRLFLEIDILTKSKH